MISLDNVMVLVMKILEVDEVVLMKTNHEVMGWDDNNELIQAITKVSLAVKDAKFGGSSFSFESG